MERRLAAILLTDMVGYSRLMGLDEEGTIARQKAHREEVFGPKISSHGGRIVKSTGDGLLVVFSSVVDAVKCAVEVQTELQGRDADLPGDRRIKYRIGINLGDIVVDGDDILGDGVNVAARLEALAEPGGICVSGTVYDHLAGKVDADFEDAGEKTLKNVSRPIRVWHWLTGHSAGHPEITDVPMPLPDKPSIAVLPFASMSDDPEQEYFADGIAEDIITALSRASWLFVISRNSSFAFKGQMSELGVIGSKLGVRYLLQGSIRKAGNRVRVSSQLIEAATERHLWADRYDALLDDIFDLQDRITENIVGAIAPKLRASEIERSKRKRPESLEAYDFLLRALPHISTITKDGIELALKLLDQAINLDPHYAHALAYAAFCRAHKPFLGWSTEEQEDFRAATELAQRAMVADPEDPIALLAAGLVAALVHRDHELSLDLLNRSLAIDPNSVHALGIRGWVHVWNGATDSALADFDRALRLGPFDPGKNSYFLGKAFALNTSGRFEEGLRWARKAVQENPKWNACYRQLIAAHELLGHHDEAQAAARLHQAIDAGFSVDRWVETGPFRRTEGQERVFSALRRAGLPK
jgi:TolB-like protein/class 3 adenylate cyclase